MDHIFKDLSTRNDLSATEIKGKEALKKYDIFLSHNSKDKKAVEEIARQLMKVGIRPWLDKWDLAAGDILAEKLDWAIENIPCAALFFGKHDAGDWHIMEYRAYLEDWAKQQARMIPVILPGAADEPNLPRFLRQALWVDMRHWKARDDDGLYQLVCGITKRAPGDSPVRKLTARQVWEWQRD